MKNNKRKKILLVEDEAIICMSEKLELERYGYDVITCSTGKKAIEISNKFEIDLVLMDINLGSGIDGTEAAGKILKNKDIPIVFLSSHTEPEIVEKTEKITSYGYVVKNTGITVLDASIKMAFKLYDANRNTEEQKQHLRATLESIGDAMIATDESGKITLMNYVAEKLTGWLRNEAQGKLLDKVFNVA